MDVTLVTDLGPEVDDQAAAELVRDLRRELLGLEVDGAEFVPLAHAPAGAKGAGVDWKSLLLTLSGTGGVLTSMLAVVQGFVSRGEHRSMTIEIGGDKLTVSGISSTEQKQLINAWIRRHRKD